MQFSILQSASVTFRIRGPDANTFLSGQFTQEIRVPIGGVAYGLWLNQKGKTLADSHVLRLSDEEHLLFAAPIAAAPLRQRLEDYLIADDVTITDETVQWAAVRLWGAQPAELAALVGAVVEPTRWTAVRGAYFFAASGGGAGWSWLLVPPSELAAWHASLSRFAREVTAAETERARLVAGLVEVPTDIGPDDLPNEGGLDEIAISYTKGCYLGQEVMSRLKNLGQVRRRLHLVRGRGAAPAARTALLQSGQRVGETRSAATTEDGAGFVAWAMLSLVNFDPQQPLQLGEGGPVLEVSRHG